MIRRINREYDAVRIGTLEQSGIRVITFKNDQVMQDLPAVLDMIVAALNSPLSPSPSGRGKAAGQGEGVIFLRITSSEAARIG